MEVKITHSQVDQLSINPAIKFTVELVFEIATEIPTSISGRLSSSNDGKAITFLQEYTVSNFEVGLLTSNVKQVVYHNNTKRSIQIELHAVLTQKAIDHIETLREKDHDKSVKFNVEVIIKALDYGVDNQAGEYLRFSSKRNYVFHEIKQSDWIKHFAPTLGIGNFLILELKIPEKKQVSEFWIELYEKLNQNVKEMETSIRSGDWQQTMFLARKFYENIKIGDNKPGHKKFKQEFDKLMSKDQHSEEGINNLYDAIWKFFEFVSKYVHDKDKQGHLNPLPVSTKEDAHFAYALALGLLNLMGKKLSS